MDVGNRQQISSYFIDKTYRVYEMEAVHAKVLDARDELLEEVFLYEQDNYPGMSSDKAWEEILKNEECKKKYVKPLMDFNATIVAFDSILMGLSTAYNDLLNTGNLDVMEEARKNACSLYVKSRDEQWFMDSLDYLASKEPNLERKFDLLDNEEVHLSKERYGYLTALYNNANKVKAHEAGKTK